MEENKKQYSKFHIYIYIFFVLFITVYIIGLLAMAKYVKKDIHVVPLNFKKAVIEQEDIIYTMNSDTKKIKVQIADQIEGKIQYKIGEDGIWIDYIEEFELEKNENIYAKLVFSDGEGPITLKKIENIIEGAKVTINAQNMVIKERIINAIGWCQ